MIPILCQACDMHVFNLDPTRLALPLRFDMFVPVSPNVRLPSGLVTTDTFCPVCFGPWLHWHSGTGAMGTYLKTKGVDGHPVTIKTADLIEKWKGVDKAQDPFTQTVENYIETKVTFKKAIKAKPGPKPKKKPRGKIAKPVQVPVMPLELKQLVAKVEGSEGQEASPETSADEFKAAKQEQDRERSRLASRKSVLRPATGR